MKRSKYYAFAEVAGEIKMIATLSCRFTRAQRGLEQVGKYYPGKVFMAYAKEVTFGDTTKLVPSGERFAIRGRTPEKRKLSKSPKLATEYSFGIPGEPIAAVLQRKNGEKRTAKLLDEGVVPDEVIDAYREQLTRSVLGR